MEEITFKIKTPAKTTARIISIAQETLKGINPYSIKELEDDNGIKYEVIDHLEYTKSDIFPSNSIMFLAVGQKLTAEQVWNHYNNSQRIFFFIVKPIVDGE